jgi:DNA-binding CsgD family transcriptional regulator
MLTNMANEAQEWAEALHNLCGEMAAPASSTFATPTIASEVPSEVRTAISSAESEVLLVEPDGSNGWSWPNDLTPLMLHAAERGQRLRMLLGSRPLHPFARRVAQRVEEAGGEVHLASTPGHPLLTVDQRVALLPAPSEFVIVSQPHVVLALRALIDGLWARSSPLVEARDSAESQDVQERIVALLAAGAKDETVARLLGLSLRTCRRHIADLMARLGAVSRFQAGANAARAGMVGTIADARVTP